MKKVKKTGKSRFFYHVDNSNFRDYFFYKIKENVDNTCFIYFKDRSCPVEFPGRYEQYRVNKYVKAGIWIEIRPEEAALMI